MLGPSCSVIFPCNRKFGHLTSYPSYLPLTWKTSTQNTAQSRGLSSRWFVSKSGNPGMVLGATQNQETRYLDTTSGIMMSGNGRVTKGWYKMTVCSVYHSSWNFICLSETVFLSSVPHVVMNSRYVIYMYLPDPHYMYLNSVLQLLHFWASNSMC